MITFCPSSVRPSVNIFKRLLLWRHWSNFAQISYGASLDRGNERLLNWSRSIGQDGCHAHICLKPSKSSSPEPRMHWGWIFAQITGDGRSTKVAKIMVAHWPFYGEVKFASPYIGIGKMLRITNDFSFEAARPMLRKFHVEPSWGRGMKYC